MKLVVGLGNPGRRHAATRHNAGLRVVERFAERRRIALDEQRFEGRFGTGWLPASDGSAVEVAVLAPETWMNRSGRAVGRAVHTLPLEDPARDLVLVFDDVDLPFGRLRVRPGGSAGGHRGVADVIASLGRSDFPRLRFGVGRPAGTADTADWVLSPFSADEEAVLSERLEHAVAALEAILLDGVEAAMNRFNRDPAAEPGNA